jgi:hypothetical protein
MASPLTLQVVRGAARDFQLQIASSSGSAPWSSTNPSPFLSSDTLSAVVWAGGDQPVTLTIVPTWVDVLSAIYLLPFANADTAGLPVGTAYIQVSVTRGAKTATVTNCRLQIQAAPGAAAAIPTYTTFNDMKLYAPWIETLQDTNDTAGFLAQRGRARSWLDNALTDRFKIRPLSPQLGSAGAFPFFMGGPVDTLPMKWFRDILAANTGIGGAPALIVTDTVREAVSKMALHYVLADEILRASESPYVNLAGNFARAAGGCLRSLKAEIDLNGDGYGEYIVNMSATDVR